MQQPKRPARAVADKVEHVLQNKDGQLGRKNLAGHVRPSGLRVR
jgi:hypothetical protein